MHDGDALYVLTNTLIPGVIKIGRAVCPLIRANSLSASHPFEIQVQHQYPHWGYLEWHIHRQVKILRVAGGRGREWFRMEPWQADALIQAAIVQVELGLAL